MAEKKNGVVAPKKGPAGGMTKMEGVRRAMAELGNDATRTDIQRFIKERFGLEMSADVISSYKADIAQKAKAKPVITKPPITQAVAKQAPAAPKAVAKKAAPKPQAKPTLAPSANGQGAAIGLSDIQAVKDLVGRVGANSLKTLIDVLSK